MELDPRHEDRPEPRGALEFLLGAALLLGLVRFVQLGAPSLWFDEVLTWGDANAPEGRPANALGYHVVRWTVEALGVGPTEGALRFAPALAGWLAIPLTAWAFRPLAGARRCAVAALVVAASPWQLQWSQTARFYTFTEVALLLGTGLALRGVLAAGGLRPIPLALGLGFGAVSGLFHPHGWIVFGATLALVFVLALGRASGGARRRLAVAGLVCVALGAVAAVFAWPMWLRFAKYKGASDPLSGMAHFVLATGAYVTPALGAAAVGALALSLKSGRAGLAGALGVVGLSAAALLLLASQATVAAQYAFGLFPWIALVAAWPVGDRGREGRFTAAWTALLALPLLAGQALYFTAESAQRPRWREAARLVHEQRGPEDLVAAIPAGVVEFYLTGGRDELARSHTAVADVSFVNDPFRALRLARRGRTVWFVVRRDNLVRFRPGDRAALERFFDEECRRVHTFPVQVTGRDLAIEVFRFDP
ncbi:MAG: hypothetical protein AAFP22_17915 [Planctomycetota bacterium]